MLDREKINPFSTILEHIADALDIPESRYQEAEERYKAVGNWLSKPDSALAQFDPDIFPQGSFRLGTVIKPVTQEDEYDIDLVCQLNISKQSITQKQLKKMVGDRLKANETYSGMLDEEGRRCWTLNYADSTKFHMDILPAIPDNYDWLLNLGVPSEFAKSAICITDREMWDIEPNWPRSNPKGYAAWFRERMKVVFETSKRTLAKQLRASIEEVPDFKVKTPLQRAIQILKRHRDIAFEKDPDDKPISIIITTLAAHAYKNESDLFDALSSIVTGMPEYIMSKNGISWITNPVNPQENFADKWQKHPQREVKFRKWLHQVREDLSIAVEKRDSHEMTGILKGVFGERTVNEALSSHMDKTSNNKKPSSLANAASFLLSRFNVSHKQVPRWPILESAHVSIKARASRNGHRTFYFNSDSSPLPIHFSLRFEATTNVPQPFEVYWQVVNTGEEARRANCLRGAFYNGSGLVHTETTLYKGMHWVECFIVKNGICVARSGEFIVNIE